MASSTIEWTQMTWNPTTGCDKLTAGCKFCYAEVMSRRLKAMGVPKYQNGKDGFDITIHPDALSIPSQWKKPQMVFVNSMSDLFHKDIPLSFIQRVFEVMNKHPEHVFQVLTKRGDMLEKYAPFLEWTSNIWMGVSVESEKVLDRVDALRKTPAKVKFLSCEPLLEGLPNLNLSGIDWVIVGGESGFKARPMEENWILNIRDNCKRSNVAFFFKQWGGKNKKAAGRELQGETYDQFPIAFDMWQRKYVNRMQRAIVH